MFDYDSSKILVLIANDDTCSRIFQELIHFQCNLFVDCRAVTNLGKANQAVNKTLGGRSIATVEHRIMHNG